MRYHRLTAILLGLAILLAVPAAITPIVAAHELQTDAGVSAVLHILPDDNPYAGHETILSFYFSSQKPDFDLQQCDCKVRVRTDAGRLLTAPVISSNGSPTEGAAKINFPAAGVYNTEVSGYISGPQSDLFHISYQIRVNPSVVEGGGSAAGWQVILISLTSLVIGSIMAAGIIRRGGRYQAQK
jgi:hypothetical protein